jgi:arylsulfatase A-like enzyme
MFRPLADTLLTVAVLLLAAGCTSGDTETDRAAEPPSRPNIVLLMPDDLGWSDVGYYGSSIETPNIDELARSGVRLDQHYVMPTCTPTRVGFLTGRYPSRYGVTGPDYGEVIDRGDPTLASLLEEHGYHTAIAGKWHVGSPPHTPLKYGFQSSYGYFDGQIDPYTHNYKQERELTDRESWHRNDEYLDEEGHATDLITDEAVRVIEEDREEPFFLYVAYSVPHFPLDEPEKWTSMYEDTFISDSRRWFAASVTHMDHGIGQIIDALERTNQRENTLVVFVSDNGGQHSWHSETEYRGRYADKPHRVLGNNFPLRGWKGELYEGGIRVPGLVNWPGQLEPGSLDAPVQIEDWLPTVYELAGGTRDLEPLNLDGKNIWPLLSGDRSGTGERTMYRKTGSAYAVREGPWKLRVDRSSDEAELYNLDEDFRETNDRSEAMPEKVQELQVLLEEFRADDR